MPIRILVTAGMVFSLFGNSSRAELLVYEGFDYEVNSNLRGKGGNSSGFIGSWKGDSVFRVAEGSLFDPAFRLDVSGQRAFGSTFNDNRDVNRSFPPIRESQVYISFLLRPERALGAGAWDGWFGWALRAGPGLLIGMPRNKDNYVMETIGSRGQQDTGFPVVESTSAMFVLRMDLLPGNDDLRLYVNPIPGEPEPALADAIKTDIDLGVPNRFSLTGPGAFSFDEFRIGTTFADVLPTSLTTCDLNSDNVCDVSDIDVLSEKIRAAELDVRIDFNQDGKLNDSDRVWFVHNLLETSLGDANLDGQFDSGDLVQVFRVGEYEDAIEMNSTWPDGDWDGDGDFTTSDLVAAFNDGGYQLSAAAVPEPNGIGMMTIALALTAVSSSRRRGRRF